MKSDIKHIHMLGICGTGMGSLAGLLKARGYQVTGSDGAVYPPMSTQLENLGIKPFSGFDPKNLNPRPDLVIVGNVIRKDNPEVMAVIENQIPYLSMPQAVSEIFLSGREPIVVAGTHGKTTTANLVAWLLDHAGLNPSFLIGGVGVNFGASFRSANGQYFVIEGDEYDTAFFDKGSKFLHYRPKYAIIGSIEFDHADIFKNIDQIKNSFSKFLELIPSNGIAVVNADDRNILDILHHAHCKIITYGFSEHSEYLIKSVKTGKAGTEFLLKHDGMELSFLSPMAGKHNVMNVTAAITLLLQLGYDYNVLNEGLKGFKGVKRRQEVRGEVSSITVIDDFAHHPTAVKETLTALKARYSDGRLWAIFEPRSNTTRRKVFEKDLAGAFDAADKIIISDVYKSEGIPEGERLDPEELVNSINSRRGNAYFINDTEHIIEFVVRNVLPGDTIIIMSNGAFDNIHQRLLDALKRRKFSQ